MTETHVKPVPLATLDTPVQALVIISELLKQLQEKTRTWAEIKDAVDQLFDLVDYPISQKEIDAIAQEVTRFGAKGLPGTQED